MVQKKLLQIVYLLPLEALEAVRPVLGHVVNLAPAPLQLLALLQQRVDEVVALAERWDLDDVVELLGLNEAHVVVLSHDSVLLERHTL